MTSTGKYFTLGGSVLAVCIGFFLFWRFSYTQTIANLLEQVKPGWTESMLHNSFPRLIVEREQLPADFPDFPEFQRLTMSDNNGDFATVMTFNGVAVELDTYSLVLKKTSARVAWGNFDEEVIKYLASNPTKSMKDSIAKADAQFDQNQATIAAEATRQQQVTQQEEAMKQARRDELDRQIAALEVEISSVTAQINELNRNPPIGGQIDQWQLLNNKFNDLIARRDELNGEKESIR